MTAKPLFLIIPLLLLASTVLGQSGWIDTVGGWHPDPPGRYYHPADTCSLVDLLDSTYIQIISIGSLLDPGVSTVNYYINPPITRVNGPLPMKIDTVGIDTVGFIQDSTWVHAPEWGVDYWGGCIVIPETGRCTEINHYKWKQFWRPELTVTTDTTYWLTPEQIEWLGKMP